MFKFIFLLLFISKNAFANDFKKITENLMIESDSLEISQNIATLQNNVKIQSTILNLNSDIIQISFKNKNISLASNIYDIDRIKDITIYMKNGYVKVSLKTSQDNYKMHCRKIFIDMIEKKVFLFEAEIMSNKTQMFGEKIIYDIEKQILFASGGEKNKVKISIYGSQKTM